MKVVILAGGRGTRLSELTSTTPKPLIKINDEPILINIMKIFLKYNHRQFIICCGYLGDLIIDYFDNNKIKKISNNKFILKHMGIEFEVECIFTGLNTQTAGRLLKVREYLKGEKFFFTYGDSIGNINLNKLNRLFNDNGKYAAITAVNPPSRFGVLEIKKDIIVSKFDEKIKKTDDWINGGFFLLSDEVIKLIKKESDIWEKDILPNIVKKNKLVAYKHYDEWYPMDTLRDKKILERLYFNKQFIWSDRFYR